MDFGRDGDGSRISRLEIHGYLSRFRENDLCLPLLGLLTKGQSVYDRWANLRLVARGTSMEELDRTYRCDVTGEPIENRFDMLTVTVFYEREPLEPSGTQFHLHPDAHPLEYPRIVDNEYHAFVADTGRIGLLKEMSVSRTKYYSYDTTDPAVADLLTTLNDALGGTR